MRDYHLKPEDATATRGPLPWLIKAKPGWRGKGREEGVLDNEAAVREYRARIGHLTTHGVNVGRLPETDTHASAGLCLWTKCGLADGVETSAAELLGANS